MIEDLEDYAMAFLHLSILGLHLLELHEAGIASLASVIAVCYALEALHAAYERRQKINERRLQSKPLPIT